MGTISWCPLLQCHLSEHCLGELVGSQICMQGISAGDPICVQGMERDMSWLCRAAQHPLLSPACCCPAAGEGALPWPGLCRD